VFRDSSSLFTTFSLWAYVVDFGTGLFAFGLLIEWKSPFKKKKKNYLLGNDTVFMNILLIEVFDKVLRYDYLNYISLSILWIAWLYVLIIFTCIEIICEIKMMIMRTKEWL
jgi:hypothetical protein